MTDYHIPIQLLRLTDSRTARRGVELYNQGKARIVDLTEHQVRDRPATTVLGECIGSRGDLYHVRLTSTPDSWGMTSTVGTCTCPVGFNCKHCAAVYLCFDNIRQQERAYQHDAARWQSLLLHCFPSAAGAVDPAGTGDTTRQSSEEAALPPATILMDVTEEFGNGRLIIFPARPAKRPTAAKPYVTKDITWKRISNRTNIPVLATHQAALERVEHLLMGGYHPHPEHWQSPSTGDEPLHAAVETLLSVGIEIRDAQTFRPVVLDAHPLPTTAVAVTTDERGWTVLTAEFEHITGGPVAALGKPVDMVAWRSPEGTLHLSRLAAAPSQGWQSLHEDVGRIRIPPESRADFAARILPGLSVQTECVSPDESFTLEPPSPPQLVAHVTQHAQPQPAAAQSGRTTGPASDNVTPPPSTELTLTFSFRYMVAGTATDVPLAPSPHPLRDAAAEAELLASPAITAAGCDATLISPQRQQFSGEEALDFLTTTVPQLEAAGIIVELDESASALSQWREAEHITVSVDAEDDSHDWFSLQVTVLVDGEKVSMAALIAALNSPDKLLFTEAGTYISVDDPQFDELTGLLEEARALTDPRRKNVQVPASRTNWWDQLEALDMVTVSPNEFLTKALDAARMDVGHIAVPAALNAQLRPYQEEGFRWLAGLARRGMGAVLADDMGLGKTLQILAMILDASSTSPWLVVAPTSVAPNWVAEAQKFAPTLRVELVTETSKRRPEPLANIAARADIVVTTYALLRLDDEEYAGLPLAGVVLDEAQNVKNPASKAFQAVRELGAPRVFAVTGTPIENSLMDAWSMFALTTPGLLGSLKQFREFYERPIAKGNAETMELLRHRTGPFLLRRRKSDVALDLPPIQHQVIHVELQPQHRKLYDLRLARERQRVLHLLTEDPDNKIEVLAALTALRQMAIDPALAAHSADAPPGAASATAPSSKLEALVPMLHGIIAEGHRVLIFSQFTTYLRSIRDRLDKECISTSYLDGTTARRAQVIDGFKKDTDSVFLISLKAGGVGLNLTEADYVFLMDPWWNPAAEAQAIDRTHRIGQTMPVTVYRLVSANTIEDKVVALQDSKRELMDAYLSPDADSSRSGGIPLNASTIKGLLS